MSPTSIGLVCSTPTPPTGLLWSTEFATAVAGKTAFFAASEYSTKWTPEAAGFNLGGGQSLSGDWNREETNIVVSAATAGGDGNSLKMNGIRRDTTVPNRSCAGSPGGVLTVPFTTGGINNTPAFGIHMGQRVQVRQRKTNGDLGGTSIIGGHRAIPWVTSHNLASGAEIDFPEGFGSTGTGSLNTSTCVGQGGTLTTKREHYTLYWSYPNSSHPGTGSIPGQEVNFNDVGWHTYDYEFGDRSLKIFRDGQLICHFGDAPLDTRAVLSGPGGSRTTPYKWSSAYNGGGTISNVNNWTYPAPYDATNNQRLKLSMQIGGVWCSPIEPAALSAATGTICYQYEIDYVRVFDMAVTGRL